MNRNSHFQRGKPVYECATCGRRTRNTGVQALDSSLCPQCWELAGLENVVQDGGTIEEITLYRDGYVAELLKLGVSMNRIRESFAIIFPKESK